MRRLLVSLAGLCSLVAAGCVRAPAPWSAPTGCRDFCARHDAPVAPPGPRTDNVVLITIDGTRWQEIFAGVDARLAPGAGVPVENARTLLPHLYRRLVDGGVALGALGAPLTATGPAFYSLPGYQELLGGRPTSGCASNRCAQVDSPTLLDRVRAGLARSADDVAAIASWERMERATSIDNRRIACSLGRTHGPTRDHLRVSDCASAVLDQASAAGPAPGHVDYRADRYTMRLALEYLTTRRPRVLFVGLGDTDEYGHAGDYARYLEALRQLDQFVGDVFDALDGMPGYGEHTTVVLTTDHGWSGDFDAHGDGDSGRVFVLAAGGAVPSRGVIPARRAAHLCDVTPTLLRLLGLPPMEGAGAGRPIDELLPGGAAAAGAP